jgi:hypothetical protein
MPVKVTGLESLGLVLPEANLEPAPFSGVSVIRHIVSLGVQCFGSFFLKQAGLKRYSGPFDWIFSSAAMVNHCLQDDFKVFLQSSYYRSIPPEERMDYPKGEKCDHTLYREQFGVRGIFNHRDPTKPEDYAYLERCVDRFRRIVRSDDGKLFLLCALDEGGSAREFEELRATLQSVTRNAALLYLRVSWQPAYGLAPQLRLVRREGSSFLFGLTPVSKNHVTQAWGRSWIRRSLEHPVDEMAIARLIGRFDLQLADTI